MRIGTKLEPNALSHSSAREAFGDDPPLKVVRDLGMIFVEWPLTADFDEDRAWALAESCGRYGLLAYFHPYLSGGIDTANFEGSDDVSAGDEKLNTNACVRFMRRIIAFARSVGEAQGQPCLINLHPPTSSHALAEIPHGYTRRILVLRSLYFHRWMESLLEGETKVMVTSEVQYAAEPHENFVRIGDSYDELLRCLSGIRRVGACWDMGHSTVNSHRLGEDLYPLYPPEAFVRRVRHVHLHDVHGREDHHPLTDGDTPYRRYLAILRSEGFDGGINLELPLSRILQHGPYRDVMAESIRRVDEAWENAEA